MSLLPKVENEISYKIIIQLIQLSELQKKMIREVENLAKSSRKLAYSLDLALNGYHFIRTLKDHLRKRKFDNGRI